MSITLLLTALSLGFFGSPHCLGMCGGIVTAFGMSMQGVPERKKSALVATYHLGRLLSYGLLGLVVSLLGTWVLAPFLHNNMPRLLLGGILIVIGLAMCGLPLLTQLEKVGMRFWQWLTPLRKQVFPLDSFGKALFAGLLWGFLPCGLVYGALMMAGVSGSTAVLGGTQSPLNGALLMVVFGLGTLPMLLATQKAVAVMRQAIGKFYLRQVNGGLLMLAGAMIMAMPILMHNMHSGHDTTQMNHSMSHAGMSMNHETLQQPISTTTEPMPTMNHDRMSHDAMSHEGMNPDAMKMDDHSQMHEMSHMNQGTETNTEAPNTETSKQ